MIKPTLGDSLRQFRKDKNWTQEKTALEAGIAYRFYQDIEGGKQQPTITTLFKLCKALNLSPDKLIMPIWKQWSEQSNH